MTRTHVQIAIAGSGFGGLGTAIRLRQQGIDDFLVFERAADLGGTWRDNSYPGCTCDVPSHLYSYSFALNPGWSRSFSPQPEIWEYLRRCAHRFGVLPHIRFDHEVRSARWDGRSRCWHLDTSRGEFTADVFVAATGPLSEPSIPDLPGLPSFRGTAFHSARWDHGHDLTGRHVAVIGTGASAIQFVPRIQPRVATLRVFQRTAPWIMPRRDRALTRAELALFGAFPPAQRAVRSAIYWGRELYALGFLHPRLAGAAQSVALRHLRRSLPDPALRDQLVPDYTIGCKRVLLSSDYLPALARENVELVTSGVREVRPDGIVTADGAEHRVDTIIFGTGFHVTDSPIADRIRGRDGRTLAEAWGGSPQAYLGTTVTGFPNLFLLLGPNTGLGHTSIVFMAECQIEYVLRALRFMRSSGVAVLEPRPGAQQEFVTGVDARMRETVWMAGGCSSWYLDRTGRNSALWPGFTWAYRRRLRRFRPGDYLTLPETVPAAAPAGSAPAPPAASAPTPQVTP
jgi:cation diffusion facilitator CzcD-associated flavoprotein CzcO